jgi:hypothetical protein
MHDRSLPTLVPVPDAPHYDRPRLGPITEAELTEARDWLRCPSQSPLMGWQVLYQFRQRGLVQTDQHIAQPHSTVNALREVGAIRRAQRRDQRVAVLLADLAILVAVASVQSWLLCHVILPLSGCLLLQSGCEASAQGRLVATVTGP